MTTTPVTTTPVTITPTTDTLSHYHLLDYKVRCAVAITTETTREAHRRHVLDPLTTIAVGRAMSCTALLASTIKQGKEYFHTSFSGLGVLRKVLAECNGDGEIRGYALPPRIVEELPAGDEVPQSVGEALGAGILSVTRSTRGDSTPYSAAVELTNGEIATDIARYLTESEQIPSAVAAGVKLAPDGTVVAAGGVLVQRLGGADLSDADLAELERKIATIGLSERLALGETPDTLVAWLSGGATNWGLLTRRPLSFRCSCSRRRMGEALFALGEAQLQEILDEVGKLEVRCPYCAETHQFKLEELFRQ